MFILNALISFTYPPSNHSFSVVFNLESLTVNQFFQFRDILSSHRRDHDVTNNLRKSLVVKVFLCNTELQSVYPRLSVALRQQVQVCSDDQYIGKGRASLEMTS